MPGDRGGQSDGAVRPGDGLTVRLGLPEALREEAARLYWQAFGAKLGRVMGPERRALAYLAAAMRPDHALVALAPSGTLLGLAGFKTPRGAFAEGSLRTMAAAYGWPGALWRRAALAALSREVDNVRFLFDGLCVTPAARGQGVGTALVAAMAAEAAARGYREMRLDVVDSNLRARALYDRLGFRPAGVHRLGPLRLLFGFEAAVTMVRPV